VSAVIETEALTKTYEGGMFSGQEVHALKDLNLTVNRGEIFGYLGPNGSGKTTTIKMLLGLIFPTSGTIRILGSEDVRSPAVKRKIGYLPEGAYYPEFLRGEEILRFYGQLYGLKGKDLSSRVDHVLELTGMNHARKRILRGYSKGMRQRIGLGQALLSDPDILILDEPTTGLDPLARTEIRDLLAHLRDQGKTLLISSHELNEVELISNRVSILYRGEIQVMGTLKELLTDRDITVQVGIVDTSAKATLEAKGVQVEDAINETTVLRAPTGMSVYDVMDLCRAAGLTVLSLAPRRETLEELFVRTVGAASEAERTVAPQS
jgi:ABC-2 type transport system ATP-binding protein